MATPASSPVADPDALHRARLALEQGQLVGIPTETVYGVVALADSAEAMQRLRAFKQVSERHVFAHHVADADAAIALLENPSLPAQRLLRKVLPGPVTFRVRHGSAWRAIRCPDHPLTLQLLRQAAGPVVGTSVTRAGRPPALDAAAAAQALGEAGAIVLEGGRCRFGRPSTLVELTDAPGRLELAVKRPGVIEERMLQKMKRFNILLVCTGNTCRSPMAEAIARQLIADNPDVSVSSAGVFAEGGAPATMEAVDAVRQLDLDLSSHRSRPLTAELIHASDRIYTMTESHRQAVLAQSPAAADKVERLDPDGDIADPIGQDLPVYHDAMSQIRRALERRLKEQQL